MIDIVTKPKANIIIDASQYDLFETCHYRYHARYNLLRVLPVKASALDKGGVMHEGFEVYYKELAKGTHFNDRVHLAVQKVRVAASDPANSNLDPDEVEWIARTVEENLEYWRYEDETFIVKLVEEPFAYVIYEDEDVRILVSGKIDLLVDKPGIGRNAEYLNLPVDHKSYSRDSEVVDLSNQFINYCGAVNSNFLYVNRVGLQTSKKAEDKYKRVMLSYDPFIIQDWKDNVTRVILSEYLECISSGIWPMNFTSCLKFNRLCEYYEVCRSSGKEAKEYKLLNNYITGEPWDVTKKMKEE